MIRITFIMLILSAAVVVSNQARADGPLWTVDAEASHVGFAARQMQVTIPGRFRRFDADVRFSADDVAAAKAQIVIDVASIETPSEDVEKEIKGEAWFDVARFPEARFEATEFEHRDGSDYHVHGLLTLRDVTRPVTLPLAVSITDDPEDPTMLRARASGEVEVSRLAYGIGQGQWADTAIVSDTVVIKIDVIARRPKS